MGGYCLNQNQTLEMDKTTRQYQVMCLLKIAKNEDFNKLSADQKQACIYGLFEQADTHFKNGNLYATRDKIFSILARENNNQKALNYIDEIDK